MSNVSSNQINAMAQEIAHLLDAHEADAKTKNDNQIEASIWNKFVGEGEAEKNQVGNGKKSLIKKRIPFKKAIVSIASYITKKGTATIQEALKRIGINWKASVEVKPEQNNDIAQAGKDGKEVSKAKINKAGKRIVTEQKKYAEVDKLRNTVKTEVKMHGKIKQMTYNEIRQKLRSEAHNATGGLLCKKSDGSSSSWTLRSSYEWAKAHHQTDCIKLMDALISAMHKLEKEHPEFKEVKYTAIIDPKTGKKTYIDGEIGSNFWDM